MRFMIAFLIIGVIFLAGCASNADLEYDSCSVSGICNAIKNTGETAPEPNIDKLEIYHFFGSSGYL